MTERASDLLSELSERLTADLQDAGATASEAIRTSMPELDLTVPESFSEMPIRSSSQFLEALYRTLRIDSSVPWAQYYILAREASHRYAEKGVPLESLMEAMAIFRRAVIARITADMAGSPYADEVVLLAQSRLGDVLEHLNSSFIRGYLDYTEARHQARQTELHGLYHIASALGRSLDVTEIAEVGLSETLNVLNLQAGAAWVREGARLKLAKTLGLEPGQETEFAVSGRPGPLKVMEIGTGPAESRVDRVAGEWSAIRAELRTKEARTDYLTGLANRPEFERAIDRAVASSERHKRRLALMMIDLDNLKQINDEHGHHVGDEAIRVLAHELQRAVRATDTCGRLGGDEFGIAMPDADEHHASDVAARVRHSLEYLNRAAKLPVRVGFSIGIAAWKPGMDWQAMYQEADKELYIDKRSRHAARKKVSDARS